MRHNVECKQGATFQLQAAWKNPDGSAIDITGYTARMQVREAYTSSAALLDSTIGSPTITLTLGGAAGTVDISISAANTAGLTAPQKNVYDLELISGGGVVTRLLEGEFNVTPEVTR